MKEYEIYDNIDLIGLKDANKINDIIETLYYKIDKNSFYFKYKDKFINVKDRTEENDIINIIEWEYLN